MAARGPAVLGLLFLIAIGGCAGRPATIHEAVLAGDAERVAELLDSDPSLANARDKEGWTPLLFAVSKRRSDIVEQLLASGADVEAGWPVEELTPHGDGSPLLMAADCGDREIAELLIAAGANVNARSTLLGGWTPLHHASCRGAGDVVLLLMASGADINAQDDQGRTPLYEAAWTGHEALVEFLLSKGAQVDLGVGRYRTPLGAAVAEGYRDVAELLLAHGADVNAPDWCGETTLHEELRWHDRQRPMVTWLLDHGADVNAADNSGRTPLHCAAEAGRPDWVEMLLKRGARIDVKDMDGRTPLFEAAGSGVPSSYWAHVHVDYFRGKREEKIERVPQDWRAVAALLIDCGAEVNAKDAYSATPLHLAALDGRTKVAEVLIARGADVNARMDCERKSPRPGPWGYSASWHLGEAEYDGATPLRFAAGEGHLETVKLLVARGADVNARDSHGATPLRIAVRAGHKAVADYLRKHGAKD